MREPLMGLGPVCAARAGIVRQAIVKPLTAKALRFRRIRAVVADGQMALELEAYE